jgi:hypothetical protein
MNMVHIDTTEVLRPAGKPSLILEHWLANRISRQKRVAAVLCDTPLDSIVP